MIRRRKQKKDRQTDSAILCCVVPSGLKHQEPSSESVAAARATCKRRKMPQRRNSTSKTVAQRFFHGPSRSLRQPTPARSLALADVIHFVRCWSLGGREEGQGGAVAIDRGGAWQSVWRQETRRIGLALLLIRNGAAVSVRGIHGLYYGISIHDETNLADGNPSAPRAW